MPQSPDKSAIAAEYQRLAPHYERIWGAYSRASICRLTALLPAPVTELKGKVLDAGCGNGVLLATLAERAKDARLFGIDLSVPMLERARDNLYSAARQVALIQANLQRLPFANSSFDTVFSGSTLHFCPEPKLAVAELARVLRPQAQLILLDWRGDTLLTRARTLVQRAVGGSSGKALGASELRQVLEAAGFKRVVISPCLLPGAFGLSAPWQALTARAIRA